METKEYWRENILQLTFLSHNPSGNTHTLAWAQMPYKWGTGLLEREAIPVHGRGCWYTLCFFLLKFCSTKQGDQLADAFSSALLPLLPVDLLKDKQSYSPLRSLWALCPLEIHMLVQPDTPLLLAVADLLHNCCCFNFSVWNLASFLTSFLLAALRSLFCPRLWEQTRCLLLLCNVFLLVPPWRRPAWRLEPRCSSSASWGWRGRMEAGWSPAGLGMPEPSLQKVLRTLRRYLLLRFPYGNKSFTFHCSMPLSAHCLNRAFQ